MAGKPWTEERRAERQRTRLHAILRSLARKKVSPADLSHYMGFASKEGGALLAFGVLEGHRRKNAPVPDGLIAELRHLYRLTDEHLQRHRDLDPSSLEAEKPACVLPLWDGRGVCRSADRDVRNHYANAINVARRTAPSALKWMDKNRRDIRRVFDVLIRLKGRVTIQGFAGPASECDLSYGGLLHALRTHSQRGKRGLLSLQDLAILALWSRGKEPPFSEDDILDCVEPFRSALKDFRKQLARSEAAAAMNGKTSHQS